MIRITNKITNLSGAIQIFDGNDGEETLIFVSVPRQDGKTHYVVLQMSVDDRVKIRKDSVLCRSGDFQQEVMKEVLQWISE